MIKILKPGKVHIATCVHCACEFSFEKEDHFDLRFRRFVQKDDIDSDMIIHEHILW